ncbi:Uncharacterised protein [Mycobacterium tuberculosis]|nr:Uncharacterised protein [Mycobacterium tuberculosis]COX81477.1 Uncharacterised protein [Mycobacterium tuberculosis]
MLPLRKHVHGEVLGSARHLGGAGAPRQADHKTRGLHARLGSEADQTTRGVTIGLGCHHKHRVVQHPHQLVERLIDHITIMNPRNVF